MNEQTRTDYFGIYRIRTHDWVLHAPCSIRQNKWPPFVMSICLLVYKLSSYLLTDKDKPSDSDEDSSGGAGGMNGGNGALRSTNQPAFLGPLLWERSLPCDGGLFQLQYMDLEEFLTENGMGCMPSGNTCSTAAQVPSQSTQSAVPSQSSQCPPSSSPPCSSSASSISSLSSSSSSSSLLGLDVPQGPGLLGGPECLHGEHPNTFFV